MKKINYQHLAELMVLSMVLLSPACSHDSMEYINDNDRNVGIAKVRAAINLPTRAGDPAHIAQGMFVSGTSGDEELDNVNIGISCYGKNGINAEGEETVVPLGLDPMAQYSDMQYVMDSGSSFFKPVYTTLEVDGVPYYDSSEIFYKGDGEYMFSAYFPYIFDFSTIDPDLFPEGYPNGPGTLKRKGDYIIVDTAMDNIGTYYDSGSQLYGCIDIMYAKGAKGSKENPDLNFTGESAFKHVLSKVTIKYKFMTSSDEGLDVFSLNDLSYLEALDNPKYYEYGVDVVGFPTIKNIYTKGLFDVKTGEISCDKTSGLGNINELNRTNVRFDYEKINNRYEVTCSFLILPQEAELCFDWNEYNIQLNGSVPQIIPESPVSNFTTGTVKATFKSGYAYTYEIEVYPHNVKVVSGNEITNWGRGESISL